MVPQSSLNCDRDVLESTYEFTCSVVLPLSSFHLRLRQKVETTRWSDRLTDMSARYFLGRVQRFDRAAYELVSKTL